METPKIIGLQKLNEQWTTESPFISVTYHKDMYPPGTDQQGVEEKWLEGRDLGEDFKLKDGFRMYHGKTVPGFPVHPHKGFETVTIILKGVIDHFDSKGSSCRYADGDVQWLTTGRGYQHSEMFPLVNEDGPNPLEMFQIWLNLDRKGKRTDPEYKMFWREDIPVIENHFNGKKTIVKIIAGELYGIHSLEPNPASWAKDKNHHVGIYLIHMEPGATFTIPKGSGTMNRNLYFYEGDTIQLEGVTIKSNYRCKLVGDEEIVIVNGEQNSSILILEGEPINEPVAQFGPFVMNTKEEIYNTFAEYNKTKFGGWKWDRPDPVNDRNAGRFVKYPDGRIEEPGAGTN
ncbi:pirin family protein [Ureibacillus sp. FSL K6-8385]|uniref:Pirin family protein n=1 Tax=Ureibacillus terrenus TaxID=118246 RepID=A0A540V394_9BACL|nr:pirin family protein [Ureibacillus terrenus]MED3662710.1 pirin family protein [Ureibacillus terrenus]MED3763656.1 pirin family protein [Ureibacillus terrenus]TQE91210.1 pirin family protein [Ureibacillus terrenus]